MAKRKVSSVEDDTQDIGPSSKQQRLRHSDYFCKLSDEALLLIFSYLSSGDLATCASVSKKWNTLSSDSLVCFIIYSAAAVENKH
jgi:hypothetical protein